MNMQQLQEQCADLARVNSGYVHVMAALACQQPNGKLVVKQEWLAALGGGETRVEAHTEPNGDIVFECVSQPSNVIPLEGPAV